MGVRRILNVANIGMDAPQVRSYSEDYWHLHPIASGREAAPDGTIVGSTKSFAGRA